MSELSLTHDHVDGDADAPVLVLLHGTGGSPADLRGVADELSPRSPVLAPAGPVSEGGAARWFRRLAEGVFDTEDVVARTHQLADFLAEATDAYGWHGRRLVAVGFSNGANIAAALTLLRPDALREAVLFASMLPVPEPPELDLSGSRVFLGNGEADPMAPTAAANALVSALRARGADVTEQWHPGGHQITSPGVRAAAEWISRR
ncbi:alpha/beta hydrolase [Saccharopolyspora gloriosae]|uniref:Phospholipase/carboxylesterase n=1 Tax=Saccharopolyspora gloriosae TaxID=455344 RepID=A0A840NGC6_9PSEU|nr:alpha/beta hydrolase [Saccharopolyspora gloriosae]MBB5069308.1 phospholipase/carboxylesterase [Saccharopolyspora gloriosae]